MTMLPFLAFLAVGGTIFFGYLGVTYLPGMLASRRLERRLRAVSGSDEPAGEGDATVVRQRDSGPLPLVDRFVSQTSAGSWLGRLIERSGVKTTAGAVVTMSMTLGIAAGLLAAMFSTVHGAGRVMSRTAAKGKGWRRRGGPKAPGLISREMMSDWTPN